MRQTAKDRPPRISWASVNGGTGAVFAGTPDLVIARTGVGVYTVKFADAMPGAIYAAILSISSGGGGGVYGVSANTVTGTGFTVWTYTSNTGASVDIGWSVQVIRQP